VKNCSARPRCRGLIAGVLLASLGLVVAGCTTPRRGSDAGPPVAAVEPVVGVNPDIPTTPNAQTSVIRYGPWTVPAATGATHNDGGMIKNQFLFGVRKPCSNCYITGINANLVFPDGRTANAADGLWLHHMVLSTFGRQDPTCGSAPLQLAGERFFAAGNERSRLRLPANAGYWVGPLDSWVMIYDLMNMEQMPQDAAIEVSYSWVPASTPNMTRVRPVWLDVNPTCGGSDLPASAGRYQYSNTWSVNVPGRIVGIGAHLHDGGTNMVVQNEATGRALCDSQAGYGGPGFERVGGHGDHGDHGDVGHVSSHLSSMTQCLSPSLDRPFARLQAGETIRFNAIYDADRYPHDDHPVMGIAIMYVAS
jgi:hypothetical protein